MMTRTNKAFTLVEIIVSLAVFSIVAVVALGALVKIIDTNKKAQTLQSALTNLDFALESMSRELRVGSVYDCQSNWNLPYFNITNIQTAACTRGQNALIAFVSSKFISNGAYNPPCPVAIVYRFDTTGYPGNIVLEKAEQLTCSDTTVGDSSNPFVPVVSPDNVTISSYELGVTYDSTNSPFPLAYIRLAGYAGTREKQKTYFDVQTSVSARIP